MQSKPKVATTDGGGAFEFDSVFYLEHSLILKDASGTVLKTYSLNFTEGAAASYTINEIAGTIDIVHTGRTIEISIPLELDATGTTTEVSGDIEFTETESEQAVNPRTGDK